ncbi:MAG: DNA-processing protein DprA [Candidatus Saccharimonas sp.]
MKINEIIPDKHPFLQITSEIAQPPKRLCYIGELPKQRAPTLAVVGTRKPTAYGKAVTTQLVSALARRGVVIVSGLALGVDALAHQATLDAGGTTIAVLPGPVSHIQPATNRGLAEQIIRSGGAIMSERSDADEYVIGPWSFLERNRIVAGISDAILITEANARSGTLNTAMHALDQGKEVFVVPGNITSPQSSGCNALIRQGATPVTSAEDILAVLIPKEQSVQAQLALGANTTETAILEQLRAGVSDGEEMQRNTGIDARELSTALTMLEITGTVRSLGANQWSLS